MENCLGGGSRRNVKTMQKDLQQLKQHQQQQQQMQQHHQLPNQNYYTQNPTTTQQQLKRLQQLSPPPPPPAKEITTSTTTAPYKIIAADCTHLPSPKQQHPTTATTITSSASIVKTSPTAAAPLTMLKECNTFTTTTTNAKQKTQNQQGSAILATTIVELLQQQSRQQQQQELDEVGGENVVVAENNTQQQQQQQQTGNETKLASLSAAENLAKPATLADCKATVSTTTAITKPRTSSCIGPYERRQVPPTKPRPPRYPDPDPDAIEVCNEQEPINSRLAAAKTLGQRHQRLHRQHNDNFDDIDNENGTANFVNTKWGGEHLLHTPHAAAAHHMHLMYAMQQQQIQQQHDYSYAYYEPGAAMRHSNVPPPEHLVPVLPTIPTPPPASASTSATSPSKFHHEIHMYPHQHQHQHQQHQELPPPPPNSMRALLSKGKKHKMTHNSVNSRHQGYQMAYNIEAQQHSNLCGISRLPQPTTTTTNAMLGSGENFYEEISLNDAQRQLHLQHHHQQQHHRLNSKSAGSLRCHSVFVEDELRRVQNRHHKILGELNLSVEAMLMPESPPSVSPPVRNAPTVSVTAASGEPILNVLRLSSTSADNICAASSFDGPADDLLSPIQPPCADLDSGFSGSSGATSCIGSLRWHKSVSRNAANSKSSIELKTLTTSGLQLQAKSPASLPCHTMKTNTMIPLQMRHQYNPQQQQLRHQSTKPQQCSNDPNEGFLTRASCGRRILNCAKIRAAEDPGPTVPRTESKARSFWNRKGWRKLPVFASTSSIDSSGLTADEHKLNSPAGWEDSSLPSHDNLTTAQTTAQTTTTTTTTAQLHNPNTTQRRAGNPGCNGLNTNLHQQQQQQQHHKTCGVHTQLQHHQYQQQQHHNNDEADHTTALASQLASNTIAGGSFSANGSSAAVGVNTAAAATTTPACSNTAETETTNNKQQDQQLIESTAPTTAVTTTLANNDDINCHQHHTHHHNNINNSWATGCSPDIISNSSSNCSNSSNNSSSGSASDEDTSTTHQQITTTSIHNSTADERNVTSSLSATNQRNSQLRSTFSRAKQHLSFDKWRSAGSTASNSGNAASIASSNNNSVNSVNGGVADSSGVNSSSSSNISATASTQQQHQQQQQQQQQQSSRRASTSCTMPTAHQSTTRDDLTTPGESPGGRLSRWFSIRRGSSHQYDISSRGNDGRQSSSSSIDIPDAAALCYGDQHSSPQKLSNACGGNLAYKMPGVPENEDDDPSAYSTSTTAATTASTARFDMDLMIPPGSRANGTARNAHERLILPMLPPAPAGLSQQQLKRRHIVAAIVHSENSYVATLQRLVNDYKKPLEESNPPVLSSTKIGTLFHRLPEILQSHKLFRIAIAECVRNWDRDEKLGDCFVSTFSKPRILEIYSGFINNFSAAMELAKMEEKRKSALADFFKVKQISAHDRLSFFGLMVKPVQRFPQFILFLQDLLKYTPQGHHDRMSLQLALTQLELLAEMLNERKREAEQYQGFKEMLGHISGTFNTRSLASTSTADGNRPRYLLREDNVTHMEFNQNGLIVKTKQRRLLLLNDKVICVSVAPKQSHDFGATEKLTFKWMYPVTDVEIVDNSTSATLSRILTAGLNRGGSLKSNSSSCNNYATNTLPINISGIGVGYPNDNSSSSPAAAQLTNGADNLCNEMSTLMYDYEVISRIHDLVGSLKGTYKELTTNTTRNLLDSIQTSIQRKNEEMAWVDSCILQLIARNKSGKEETYTFQTQNPNVKKEWVTELRLAQLALDTNNSPAWETTSNETMSSTAYGTAFYETSQQTQQQQQQQLLLHKQSNKMPLFVKAMPVYKSQHQTEVRCGCYYTIANDIKLTGNARRRHKQQNYLWICTSDGSSSHIAVLSQHHQQAGNLRDVGAFDLVETQVTAMEFVKGFDTSSHSSSSSNKRDDHHHHLQQHHSNSNLLGDLIWMGTDSRKLFIYSAQNPEQEEQLSFCTVPGAITRILYHFDSVYVALSNATILIYRRSYDGIWMLKDPQFVQLGDSGLPVPSLLPINMNIYAACGNRVFVLNALNGEVQKSFEVQHGANQQVNLMAHSGIGLWIALKNSTVLCLYHTETFKHLQDINIGTSVLRNDSKKEKTVNNSSIYVTALMACKGLLWVGTNVGIAVTIPLPRLEGVPIVGGGISMSCHAHFGPITFLLPLIPKTYANYKPPSALQAPPVAEPTPPPVPSMGDDLELPAIDADPKKLTEADLDESTVILRRDLPKDDVRSGHASHAAGTLRDLNHCGGDSAASSPRSSKLDKQHSLDQSFSAKIRASLASSPAFHRKRLREEFVRACKTLPRGSSAAHFSSSPHSNVSTLSHGDHGYCDVYGLYGKLIFVKEDYDAAEGTQGNLIDMMYEGMRRSDPELAAIPGKVTTLDRRLRMKAARPRSLDLSNWSVDSKSSSLYTSSGSEESMGIRYFGGRSVSRNSSSASHKTSGNGSDLGNISENGLMTTVEVHQPHQHSTPKSEDGFKLMLADCKPTINNNSNNNKMNLLQSSNTLSATTGGGGGGSTVPAAAATLKRKQKQNAKQQQQQQNADGPRTIITLTGGRGYWRHIWYNNAHSPGSGSSKTGTLSSGGSSPLIANSNDAHIVVWEKKL